MATPLGVVQQAQQLANTLGVNNWQLQSGSYNGVTFHVVESFLDTLNNTFNPAAGIVDATTSLIGVSTGNTTTQTDNNHLPYGTSAVSTGAFDSGQRKLAIFTPPNNYDVFEDQGWYGETYTMVGIIWGAAYSKALNNLLNVMFDDSTALPQNRNVLVHPVLGKIPGVVKLVNYERVYKSNLWRAVMYKFTFRSTKPFAKLNTGVPGLTGEIDNAVSSILTISTTLLNTWGTIQALQISFGSSGNTSNVQQVLQQSQKQVQSSVNVGLSVTKLLVNNLKPVNYNNNSLNNTPTQTINDPQLLNFFRTNITPGTINSILFLNNDSINDCINTINQINDNTLYSTISLLQAFQTSINQLASQLINSYYGKIQEYEVPYTTSLFNICFLKSLNFASQSALILQLNSNKLFNINSIKKGTILTLPINGVQNTRSS